MVDNKELESFLGRNYNNEELNTLLNGFGDLLDNCIQYMGKTLLNDIDKTRGGDEKIPILMLLRHFIDLIDSISILIRKSSIDPCKVILRSALETYLSIEFLLNNETDKYSKSFIVTYNKQLLEILKNVTPKNEEDQLSFDKEVASTKRMLEKEPYLEITKEFDRIKNRRKGKINWFSLFNGPNSLRDLAKELNQQSLYLSYKHLSGSTHATNVHVGRLYAFEGKPSFVQIRYAKDAQFLMSLAMTMIIQILLKYIHTKLPEFKKDLADWYLTIKERYYQITDEAPLIKLK